MKKFVMVVLSLMLMLSFCACGDESSSDPNIGLYEAYSAEGSGVEVSIVDLYENGFTIELKNKGKCDLNLDGTEFSGKWTLTNGKLHISGKGVVLDGTFADGVMTLIDMMDEGVNVNLIRQEEDVSGAEN